MAYDYACGPYHSKGTREPETLPRGTTIVSGDYYHYYNETVQSSLTIKNYGWVHNGDGGTIESASVQKTGTLHVTGGTVSKVVVADGGWLGIIIDAKFTSDVNLSVSASSAVSGGGSIDFSYHSEKTISGLDIPAFCGMGIQGDILVKKISVSGRLELYGTGAATDISILKGGGLLLHSKASVDGLTIAGGGNVYLKGPDVVFSGNLRVGGMLHLHDYDEETSDPEISATVTGTLIFDLTERKSGQGFFVDDLDSLTCDSFAVTVSASQAKGTYTLAAGAAGFDKTVTVLNTTGGELGKLALGSTTVIGGVDYTLALGGSSHQLSLTLAAHTMTDTTIPEVKNIKASTTKWTNRNVTVTASFVDDVGIAARQYKIGNGAWTAYTDGVTVSENTTVYFKATDTAGNESKVASYEVANIDKTPPAKPVATADITTPTKQNVRVTATFSDDSVQRQYSRNGNAWTPYSTEIVMVENGNVRFRGIDAAGNISEVTTCKVSNIEKSGPAKPIVTANITAPTNKSVTITATFSKDSARKQYSTDKKNWKTYTSAITVNKNGTYYFRGLNEVSRSSEITTYTVSNIDKTAPTAPKLKASTTKPTNKNVTITATFSSDSAKKQYSTDKKSWKTYSTAVSVDKNATYYFRGIDAAGNISKAASIKVANIDKKPPAPPKVVVSNTKPTNKNVKLKTVFSKDSVKKQYSADNKNWKTCPPTVAVSKNGTYYFRGIDAAGNVSKVKTIKVTNIDKTAPDAPTVKASTTAPTNKSVTIKATFSKDSAKKQYSLDNKKWQTYSKAVSTDKNATYYFRGIDAAGNVSKVTSIKVTNIDKVAPNAPKLKASTTNPTNKNVTITATFSTDTAQKQYSTDSKTWKNCSATVSVDKNGTYYFRGIDAAGNISKVTNIKVANIDKAAPDAPTVKVSSTAPTTAGVTVTATFSKDSVKKQYTLDGKTWQNYTGPLVLKTNEIIDFRGIDAAGNASAIKTATVNNIMDTANNKWENATEAPKHIFAAVSDPFDKVDYYDLSNVENLSIVMNSGKIKASFFDEYKQAVECSTYIGMNEVSDSTFTIAASEDPEKNSRFFDSISEEVKFLKIEAAASGTNGYCLYSNIG